MLSGYGFLSGTESGVTSWRRLSAATDRPGLEGTTRISPQRVLNGVHARLQRAMDARERCVKSRSTSTLRSAMNSAHSAWPCFENVHDPTA